jgi:hypothetical protein
MRMPQDDSYGMLGLGWLPEFFPVTGAQVNAIRFPKKSKKQDTQMGWFATDFTF